MTWDKFDELFASFARPYSIYICATSCAVSLPLSIFVKSGDIVIGAIAAIVGGVAGGTAVLRTIDIKTKASAATADKKTAAQGGPVAPIKTEQVA